MLALRMVCGAGSSIGGSKVTSLTHPTKIFITRFYSQEGRDAIWKTARSGRRRAFTEKVMQPAGEAGNGSTIGCTNFDLV